MDELKKQVRGIICEALEMDSPEDINYADDLSQMGMDSINYIRIIIMIEDTFNLEFSEEKLVITKTRTVNDFCEIITDIPESNAVN